MPASPLPAPRRILTATDAQGTGVILDDTTPFANPKEELKAFVGYVQPDAIGKPDQALKWAEYKPDRISHDDQISLRWVDLPPHNKGFQHYTNTFGKSCKKKIPIDYLIMTHGELELELPDGQKRTVKVGDAIIQAANVHSWNNNTDQWASECATLPSTRFVGVAVPSEAAKVDGKTLDQPPVNGFHAQF
uniref:Cupin 2 conserved barrel domain-containing protein n=1 Tax=Kwoniella dejecticola CBS 10117 TaxID=1296121 RepID=A0A1A5ZW11_9TREE|nr:uncharacterized protein I303_07905 [Kwoniella dejecticola CBS 10117]OBR81992.1 hypothetical protein I303_07905 [Kwoniella dejecticola CBS 10117]